MGFPFHLLACADVCGCKMCVNFAQVNSQLQYVVLILLLIL